MSTEYWSNSYRSFMINYSTKKTTFLFELGDFYTDSNKIVFKQSDQIEIPCLFRYTQFNSKNVLIISCDLADSAFYKPINELLLMKKLDLHIFYEDSSNKLDYYQGIIKYTSLDNRGEIILNFNSYEISFQNKKNRFHVFNNAIYIAIDELVLFYRIIKIPDKLAGTFKKFELALFSKALCNDSDDVILANYKKYELYTF